MQYSPPQYLEEVYNRRRLNFEEMLKSDCKNLKRCTLSDKILAEDKGRQGMYFRRKAYDQLLAWKKDYADSYAILIEGARRVGKTTLAEEFAKNEYSSYILLDFANVSDTVTSCFDDVHDLDMFFLRLQAATGIDLIKNDSVIIFDEIQLFPKARQAIKYLVKDGRFHYIGELAKDEFADMNIQVMGIVSDAELGGDNEMALDNAKYILEVSGASYLNVLFNSPDMYESLLKFVGGYPTTIFMDSQGNVVGSEILGMRSKEVFLEEAQQRLDMLND
jgi:hypothetical protein